MEIYEIFASEGGYRYAGGIWADGPIMDQSPWFKTRAAAKKAVERVKKRVDKWYESHYTPEELAWMKKISQEYAE